MYKKIGYSIWLVSLMVLLIFIALIFGMSYNFFTEIQKNQLKSELELLAKGIELSGSEYFDGLEITEYRMTWIEQDGAVIFDNMADIEKMENHVDREEVKEAIETGFGVSIRSSNTLSEKQIYAAKLLDDGTVIRISASYAMFWTSIFNFAQALLISLVFIIVGAYIIALRISKKIVRPINNIDLDNPFRSEAAHGLEEIRPLLLRIKAQKEQHIRDKEELEKATRMREEFTANVSHELKTPLHSISGHAELIVNGMTKEEDIIPFAGKIREEAGRLTTLVEDIIELTQLDTGAIEYTKETIDLYKIVENTVDSLRTTAEGMGVNIEFEGEKAVISGIPKIVYSMVYNLMDNGIKYNRKNGTLKISVRKKDENAVLKVTDTGIGIPKDEVRIIFERFYVVDKSRSKAVGGTGLGLSIVKHGCIIHGAELNVESEVGVGTTFTIKF